MKKLKQRLQSLGWKGDNGCVLSGDTSYIGILDWDNGKCAFQAKELDKELLAVFYAKMRCGRWIMPSVLYNHFVHLGYCPTDCNHQCDILEEVVVTPMNNLDEDEIYVSKLPVGLDTNAMGTLYNLCSRNGNGFYRQTCSAHNINGRQGFNILESCS